MNELQPDTNAARAFWPVRPPHRWPAIAVLVAAAALAGCARTPPAPVPTRPPDVLFARPVVRDVTDFEDFTGRTEAYRKVDVMPQITGALEKVHFKDGATVAEGALLFEIDARLYAAERDMARAAVGEAKARLALAESSYQRAKSIWDRQAAGKEDLDRAAAEWDGAKAALAKADAALAKAETNLGYTRITARYTGRLSNRRVDPGNVVKENETVLTTLTVLDPIYVTFDIDERTLLRIRRLIAEGKVPSARDAELHVKVGLADEEGYSFDAVLTFADNQLDQNTGTLRARAEMHNPAVQLRPLPAVIGSAATVTAAQMGVKLLSPGMFVRVRLPVGKPHPAILIPEEALGSDQGQKFVFVLNENDEVVYRPVVLGPQDGRLRAIEKGVGPADRVIVSGHQRVRAGVKVTPKPAEQPKPAAEARSPSGRG
jgi:multidrug efflux system membrane fusion protein